MARQAADAARAHVDDPIARGSIHHRRMLVVVAAGGQSRAAAGVEVEAVDLAAPETVGILVARVHQAAAVARERSRLVIGLTAWQIGTDVLQVRLRRLDEVGDADLVGLVRLALCPGHPLAIGRDHRQQDALAFVVRLVGELPGLLAVGCGQPDVVVQPEAGQCFVVRIAKQRGTLPGRHLGDEQQVASRRMPIRCAFVLAGHLWQVDPVGAVGLDGVEVVPAVRTLLLQRDPPGRHIPPRPDGVLGPRRRIDGGAGRTVERAVRLGRRQRGDHPHRRQRRVSAGRTVDIHRDTLTNGPLIAHCPAPCQIRSLGYFARGRDGRARAVPVRRRSRAGRSTPRVRCLRTGCAPGRSLPKSRIRPARRRH